MIIDGHSHACGKFLSIESLIETLDENGVDKVVLVPGELNSKSEYILPNIAERFSKHNVVKAMNYLIRLAIKLTNKVKDIPAGNKYVFDLKTRANDRIIQFIWVTKNIKETTEYLDSNYTDWKFHGVKLHQCWENFSVGSDFFKEVAEWTEKHNLPLFIHLYSNNETAKLIEYKRNHPKLILIIAHLFGLELLINQKLKDENFYFDISPAPLISNYRLLKAIEYMGPEKILFGTDTPYGVKNNIQRNMNRIKQLEISDEEKNMILGLNMKKLLRL